MVCTLTTSSGPGFILKEELHKSSQPLPGYKYILSYYELLERIWWIQESTWSHTRGCIPL